MKSKEQPALCAGDRGRRTAKPGAARRPVVGALTLAVLAAAGQAAAAGEPAAAAASSLGGNGPASTTANGGAANPGAPTGGSGGKSGGDPAGGETTKPVAGSELLLFDELPEVVSAGRKAQTLDKTSAAVTLINREDIRLSGLTNIAEILQFGPGVDLLRTDRNRYDVGVRGFHQNLSDRLLVLINGRNANSPFSAEVDWLSLPLLVGDIDRVEIVRGPGGAAWGANAFSGVVNYITVKPEQVRGLTLSTQWDNFGDSYSYLRFAEVAGDVSFRVSAGYDNKKSSSDALNNDNFTSSDWSRDLRLDSEVIVKLGDKSTLTMGAAHAELRRGPFEFLSFLPTADERRDMTRVFARVDQKFGDNATGFVQVFSNIADENRPAISRVYSFEVDTEAQVNMTLGQHQLTLGGNVRYSQSNPTAGDQQFVYPASEYTEWLGGVYLIDRWALSERLTFEPQVRLDSYEGTTTDWSTRLSLLGTLDEAGHHTLRVSGARSFRSPYPGLRDVTTQRSPLPAPPFPAGTYAFSLLPAGREFVNENVTAAELGLTSRLSEHVTLRNEAYIHWYNDLVGIEQLSATIPQTYRITQGSEATAPGFETELSYVDGGTKLSAWFAYNDFLRESQTQNIRAFYPAKFKTGVTLRTELVDRWVGNVNYRWQDLTFADDVSGAPARPVHRLDLTLSRPLFDERANLMFGVTDVLNDDNNATHGVGGISPHETPGRTFFVRVEMKF